MCSPPANPSNPVSATLNTILSGHVRNFLQRIIKQYKHNTCHPKRFQCTNRRLKIVNCDRFVANSPLPTVTERPGGITGTFCGLASNVNTGFFPRKHHSCAYTAESTLRVPSSSRCLPPLRQRLTSRGREGGFLRASLAH